MRQREIRLYFQRLKFNKRKKIDSSFQTRTVMVQISACAYNTLRLVQVHQLSPKKGEEEGEGGRGEGEGEGEE